MVSHCGFDLHFSDNVHSSILAGESHGRGACWVTDNGVAKNWTWQKWVSTECLVQMYFSFPLIHPEYSNIVLCICSTIIDHLILNGSYKPFNLISFNRLGDLEILHMFSRATELVPQLGLESRPWIWICFIFLCALCSCIVSLLPLPISFWMYDISVY